MDNYLYSEKFTNELLRYNAISEILMSVISAAILCVFISGIRLFVQARKGARSFKGFHKKDWVSVVVLLVFLGISALSLYEIPSILIYPELSWNYILHQDFFNLFMVGILFFLLLAVSLLYLFIASYFPKQRQKSIFLLIGLSIVSGIANAMIIFLMNESITRVENYGVESLKSMIILFALVVFVYLYSLKTLRYRLIKVTNDLVYDKRLEITNKLLHSTYQKLEKVEKGKIYATLNNDTERIGGFVNNIVAVATAIITVLACFVYLGFLHLQGFIIFLLVLLLLGFIHQRISRAGHKLFLKSRDIQNIFFKLEWGKMVT